MHSALVKQLGNAVGIAPELYDYLQLSVSSDQTLPSCYQTTELASSSFMVAAIALAEFYNDCDKRPPITKINVDNRLASLWFNNSLVPLDWELQGLWDSVAGDYACADGWIRLHTNAPHHKLAALSILKCEDSRDAVASCVINWTGSKLEQAIVNAGGCAAQMRSANEWNKHPQGMAVAQEPLIAWSEKHVEYSGQSQPTTQPLSGLRVLDLTRVLAGPISTRFLAAYGADVLRIDPESWNEPGVVPEVTLGKRCAHIDLKSRAGLTQFRKLLKSADVLVHGYRPGAMHGLDLDDESLQSLNPKLITVSLCAYGWTGPWAQRRGFDSLVQMSCGIAEEGMQQYQSDKPHPLPVQSLDHATGYLMAAAVLKALTQRRASGRIMSARLSLARTACLLQSYKQSVSSASGQSAASTSFEAVTSADLHPHIEHTSWGAAQRVSFPVEMDGIKPHWNFPATELRSMDAVWL